MIDLAKTHATTTKIKCKPVFIIAVVIAYAVISPIESDAGQVVVQPRGETVSSLQPNTIRYTYDQTITASSGYQINNTPSSFYVSRGYLGFQLPNHIAGTYISSAILSSYTGGKAPSSLYLAGSDSWNASSLTWNNQPGGAGSPIASFNQNGRASSGRTTWDITNVVNGEYQGDGYLSLMLRVDNESYQGNTLYSSMTISTTPADVSVVMYLVCTIDPLPTDPCTLRSDLNGDHQIDSSSTSPDKTTSGTPFRFWVNDDHDTGDQNNGNDLNDGGVDCYDEVISCVRDLEDFAPLNLHLPASLVSMLQQGCYIVFTATGSGAIHLVPISRPGFDYLYDPIYARSLVGTSGVTMYEMYAYESDTAAVPLDQLFSSPQAGDRTIGFMFEGMMAGDLVLSGQIINPDGSVVAQTENFYLHLDEITNYYDHFTVGDSTQEYYPIGSPTIESTPGTFSALTNPLTLHQNISGKSDSSQPYILFVHGWRMQTWNRRRFAETAFKRLYWAGYRGSFGLFSWPTEYVDSDLISSASDIDNYDRSEYQAWKSASGLRTVLDLLETGSQPRTRILAHSMGNVVASEALRLGIGTGSKKITTYIATQGATIAAAYQQSVPQVNAIGAEADVYRYWTASAPYFYGIDGMVSQGIYNLCNPSDYALGKWDLNQSNKPDYDYFGVHDLPAYRYDFNHFGTQEYDKENANGSWVAFNLLDAAQRYEAFAFAAPSSSRALGAEPTTQGEVQGTVRLDAYPIHYGSASTDHSAEFLSSIQSQHYYWENVLGYGGLGSIPYNPETTTPSNFQNWSLMWFGFSGTDTTPQASFSGDGVSNLTKYAFGLNPLQSNGVAQVSISKSQGQVQIGFWRRASLTDVSYTVEQSSDLKTWATTAVSLSVVSSSGQLELVSGMVPDNGAIQQFYRMTVGLSQSLSGTSVPLHRWPNNMLQPSEACEGVSSNHQN